MRKKTPIHVYTDAEKDFMRDYLPGVPRREFAILFNEHFGLTLTASQIIGATKRYGFFNGLDFRFRPGQVSHNKGIRKVYPGCEKTWFSKGHMPHNHKPVGSERINRDGYREIKIEEPKKWRGLHVLVWEKANGPVPKGYAVVFGDGDRTNVDLENLILLTRAELAVMNKQKWVGGSAELTRVGKTLANISMAIRKRTKEKGR